MEIRQQGLRGPQSSASPAIGGSNELLSEQPTGSDITQLLNAWCDGDHSSGDELFGLIYPELKRIAARAWSIQRKDDQSLQVTDLVHETYLRLGGSLTNVESREQFFGIIALVVRRVLVDRARKRKSQKRGGNSIRVEMKDDVARVDPGVDLVALDHALDALQSESNTAARIVELRFFLGLNRQEVAEELGLSIATVGRRWRFARAYLAKRMGPPSSKAAASSREDN